MQRDRRTDHENEVEAFDHPGAAPAVWGLHVTVRLTLAAALVAGLTVLAKHTAEDPARTWTDPPATSGVALTAARPAVVASLLSIESDAIGPDVHYDAPNWNANDGLREDGLTAGGFETIEAPFLRITMSETTDAAPAPSLFVTLVRRAAQIDGLSVLRVGHRGEVETKFGLFETVEAVLGSDGKRTCTGFQSLSIRHVRVDGWLCGILGQAPETRTITCAIDRLRLAGPAAPVIETVFQNAQAHRGGSCNAPAHVAEITGTLPAGTRSNGRIGKIAAQTGRQPEGIVQARR